VSTEDAFFGRVRSEHDLAPRLASAARIGRHQIGGEAGRL
jgi:hypothetical protein